MRKVVVSEEVHKTLRELRYFLTHVYHMSLEGADARVDKIYESLARLKTPADTALCRFRRWRELGYRCVSFESWVFAYEVFENGVIIRDMAHVGVLGDVEF